MTTINGSYNTAKIYTDTVDENAAVQIEQLCSQEFIAGCRIRIMPDVHAGAGCVIGFTADLGDIVIPNIVGVDIGCGMLTVELGKQEVDFEKLDHIIRESVPSGKNVHDGRIARFPEILNLVCYRALKDAKRFERSIGTLGSGNHFIEIDTDDDGSKYLVIHTGSRNLGKQVAEHYQEMAYDILRGKDKIFDEQKQIIAKYSAAGRKAEIQEAIKELKKSFQAKEIDIPKELCYLTGEYRDMYLADMKICQEYASANRLTITKIIIDKLFGRELSDFSYFETVHNYIDLENNIVRKGAVSAKEGEKLLIPINMRDGSLICIGKGNEDWNCSAPHGAGRLYSRAAAKENFTVDEFERAMDGIFTTSVGASTLDECPMAYKNMDDIVSNIGPTADIIKIIKPVYNFKAGE
ncbi:MAG: RtcB family protein [Eubacteriales bacterium]